jgi:TPR repeat protein
VYWYRKAAAQGLAAAENSLAYMLASGRGTRADTSEAARLFKDAAAHGLQDMAKQNLGILKSGNNKKGYVLVSMLREERSRDHVLRDKTIDLTSWLDYARRPKIN